MRTFFLIFALLISCNIRSQMKADGYLGIMPAWYHLEQLGQNLRETTIHNRINLSYDFSPTVIGVVQFRNRLIHGQTINKIPGYAAFIDNDQGFLDMSHNIASGNSAILNMTIDRLWLDFYLGKLQVRAGRQRINWGQAMVWNPNDIFNAYSFFDLDYPERPGIDGLRLQLFTGPASQLDGVFKIDSDHKKTMAMRFRFNAGRYDWQVLGGRLNDQDWTAGLGWSGHIGDAGFYGEGTLLIPDHGEETVIASTGMNYTFKNSLLWQSEFLYSSNLSNTIDGFSNFITGQASIKNLSVTKYTIFSSVQYPFTPLFSGTLNAMHFVGTNGWYAGPSLEYSIQRNLYLSAFLNLFLNKTLQNGNTTDYLGAVRLKWFF
ncbi:hypothetical protein [Marinilabilia salmonicolor]|jgi:hypothetical protein|uniref:Alginate export protein n=1 Tax=Marinilabilia salmonicolor TaxID=989 RepID=A0A368UQX4_9BACT|nr:hypothetical protein [Marinilabilia salmonicolor]RCW29814.1 hypothetical protein DFO77_1257 [Marinilabilia salmonicolor]